MISRRRRKLVARGAGSVVVGGSNEGSISTTVTQHNWQFLLFRRRTRPGIREMADRLAREVREQWQDEAIRLEVGGDDRLPMRWDPTPATVCASVAESRAWMLSHDRNLASAGSERWASTDDDLAGGDLDLVDVWLSGSPTRRLVMLGEAGSGKTDLAIRTLTLVLARRAEFDGLVPVLIPVVSWEAGTVESWLERWLVTNYRFLGEIAPGGDARTYAQTLLNDDKIALLLDGFDELPPSRRSAFAMQLSLELDARPRRALMVTSRPVEFSAVMLEADTARVRLGAAVGVRLLPQPAEAVISHLRRSLIPSRWDGVAASVRQGGLLAAVLETPLMVMLADVGYNTTPDQAPHPRELLEFAGPKQVEQHLLDSYVPVRFRAERWRIDDVKRWLGFLAATLNSRTNSIDLTWWNLRPTRPDRAAFRLTWTSLVVLIVAAGWAAVSAAIFNGWFYQDLGLGIVGGARIGAAAAICYAMILTLTRSPSAALLAATGAYIAGTLSDSYDLAVGAAIAGGLAWRPIAVIRPRWWHSLLFGAVVATVGALIQAPPPSSVAVGTPPTPWTQGFGAGFVDGWSSRGDEVVNGWLLSCLVAAMLLWGAARIAPGQEPAETIKPVGWGVVAGLVVAIIDGWTDGVRTDVTHGWMIGPADGLAAGIAVWYVTTQYPARPGGAGSQRAVPKVLRCR